jgi:hypothetical protein
MAKVSIGLRGWRFEEDEVFDAEGTLKRLTEMPPDARERILRLTALIGEPCDACYIEHGDSEIEQCNVGAIVYGEPMGEVLLCDAHESDFLYWFREEGGEELAGTREMANGFQAWFDEGNRAPAGYGGLDHVEEAPEQLPAFDPHEIQGLEDDLQEMDESEREALDVDLSDLDLDVGP